MREGIEPTQAQEAAVDILQRTAQELEAATRVPGNEYLAKVMQAILALVPACQQAGSLGGGPVMPPTTAKPQPPAQVAKGRQDMVLDDYDDDLDDGSTAGGQRSRSPV